LVFLFLLLAATDARAQAPLMLRGHVDGEYWDTDTSSNLLSRNGGRPTMLGRVTLWGAVQPVPQLVAYGLVDATTSSAGDDYDAHVDQAGVRYTHSPWLVIDAGRITAPLGTFAARRFSWRNPLIGAPDGYPVTYPYGVVFSGAAKLVDVRAGAVSLPLAHEDYTPEPDHALRPVLAVGVTPVFGFRLGAGYTWGPYLGDSVVGADAGNRPWRSYDQRVTTADLSFSRGYFELVAEAAHSSYDVPTRAEASEGVTWYVEAKYTFTPRLFVATRLGRNDYPFIRRVAPDTWVARSTDFHDEELGIGVRLGAFTLLKASYRQDRWDVDAGNAAFVRPGGRAFAVQLSQQFDVVDLVTRRR
jgi:hypothetical protein